MDTSLHMTRLNTVLMLDMKVVFAIMDAYANSASNVAVHQFVNINDRNTRVLYAMEMAYAIITNSAAHALHVMDLQYVNIKKFDMCVANAMVVAYVNMIKLDRVV